MIAAAIRIDMLLMLSPFLNKQSHPHPHPHPVTIFMRRDPGLLSLQLGEVRGCGSSTPTSFYDRTASGSWRHPPGSRWREIALVGGPPHRGNPGTSPVVSLQSSGSIVSRGRQAVQVATHASPATFDEL